MKIDLAGLNAAIKATTNLEVTYTKKVRTAIDSKTGEQYPVGHLRIHVVDTDIVIYEGERNWPAQIELELDCEASCWAVDIEFVTAMALINRFTTKREL